MIADSLLGPVLDHLPSEPAMVRQDEAPKIIPGFPGLISFYSEQGTSGNITDQSFKGAYFQEKPFPGKDFQATIRPTVTSDWILVVLLLCLVIITWIRFSYKKRLGLILQSSFSKQNLTLLIREGGFGYDMINLSLGFVFIITLALLLYLASTGITGNSSGGEGSLMIFLALVAGIIVWLIFRLVLIRLLRWTFKTNETTTFYLMNTMTFQIIIGIFLLPLLVMNVYAHTPFLLFISLGVGSILFILKLFRGLIIGLSDTNFSIFYLFFYLCTVEILPILVIVKLAMNYL
jgi:hypothetical protein